MNAEHIILKTRDKVVSVPNRWELLTPKQYLFLVALITQYANKLATMDDVRLFYVFRVLGINPASITDPEAMANLTIISEQIDFIFDENGKINLSFLAQLVPEIEVSGKLFKKRYRGYEINTAFDTLTCSLTAAQFIDAKQLLDGKAAQLPLLAAVLYSPLPYSSEIAHDLAEKFARVNPFVLQAVSLNFQAFITYLFTRTHFSLLSAGTKNNIPEIATGMLETMYNLSADGMGDVQSVKQMPIIEFLTILRKKIIESVKSMHAAKIDIVKIANATGLPTRIIKKML